MSGCFGGAVAIGVAIALAPAHGQVVNSFVDGDFRHPAPEPGTFLLIDSGQRYGNWRVVGANGSVAFVSGTYQHGGFSFPAQTGDRLAPADTWVNLAGLTQSATGIAHSPYATNIGESYTLSLYVGNVFDPGGPYGTSSTVAVYENSTYLGSFTNSLGQGSTQETWQQFTLTFNADAPFTVMSFINGDPPGDLNCGIDNITLAPTDNAKHRPK